MVPKNPLTLTDRLPDAVSIEITTACPLECSYCDRKRGSGAMLHWDQFVALKERLKTIPNLKRLTFCGIGEAPLHKDFYRMIEEFSAYKVSLITSGTLRLDFAQLAALRNVDLLIFSIDATDAEMVKLICGERFDYETLQENLRQARDFVLQCRRQGRAFNAIVNCTVNETNLRELPKLVDLAAAHKFTAVHYSLPWAREAFIEANAAILQEQFAEAAARAAKFGVFLDDPFKSFCCIAFTSIMPYVNIRGELHPCGYALNQNYGVGNIFSDDFETLWENERYRSFRSGQLCSGCWMMRMEQFRKEGTPHVG